MIDNQLNNLCKKANKELMALAKLKPYLKTEKM